MFVTLTVLALAVLMIIVEHLKLGRTFSTVRRWWMHCR